MFIYNMDNITTEIVSHEIMLPFPIYNILFNNNNELQQSFDNIETRCKPCKDDFIKHLETATIIQSDVDDKLSCAICQESFKLNDKVIELPCESGPHYFHVSSSDCEGIVPWLKQNNSCPVCRFQFPHKPEVVEQAEPSSPQIRQINISEIETRIQHFVEQQFEDDIQRAIELSFQ